MIDLRTCQVGQRVERGDGTILEYELRDRGYTAYPHKVGGEWYTDDGLFMTHSVDADLDIARIIPFEPAKSDKHLSVAAWERFPWITDRLPGIKDASLSGKVLVSGKYGLFFCGCSGVKDDEKWMHLPDWAPAELTPQEEALALLEGKADNWVPSAEEWLVFRKAIKP